jgi:hypothetical protein
MINKVTKVCLLIKCVKHVIHTFPSLNLEILRNVLSVSVSVCTVPYILCINIVLLLLHNAI